MNTKEKNRLEAELQHYTGNIYKDIDGINSLLEEAAAKEEDKLSSLPENLGSSSLADEIASYSEKINEALDLTQNLRESLDKIYSLLELNPTAKHQRGSGRKHPMLAGMEGARDKSLHVKLSSRLLEAMKQQAAKERMSTNELVNRSILGYLE